MKKFIYILVLIPLLFLNSCKDEELPTELTGTTWEYKVTVLNITTAISYKFTSATAYTYTTAIDGDNAEYDGTYVYDSETGTVVFDEGEETEMTGKIESNEMKVDIMGMGSLTFKKK